jgi:hypothetical protein
MAGGALAVVLCLFRSVRWDVKKQLTIIELPMNIYTAVWSRKNSGHMDGNGIVFL